MAIRRSLDKSGYVKLVRPSRAERQAYQRDVERANIRLDQLLDKGINLDNRSMIVGIPYMEHNTTNDVEWPLAANFFTGLDALEHLYVQKPGEPPDRPIVIDLTSYGGDLYLSQGIYSRISACTVPVHIRVFGPCMSGGSLILQAADYRLMSEHSRIMLHYGFTGDEGTSDPRRRREELREHEQLMETLIGIYLSKCKNNATALAEDMRARLLENLSKLNPARTKELESFLSDADEEVLAERMFREVILPIETYLDARTCLRYGLVDKIIDPSDIQTMGVE